ncbi:MAG: group 1 glycosyl transferase [Chloroflexi bacterium]|nr:group 1 glycosyl transferase [Chloroflexota bacterium]|tara:strand:- start:8762 stop:9970 length:1209 start_codon:yes stop_codon:yes gene_type:complete
MKVALVCPASLPATQFGGIVFLAVDLAREISEMGHDVTIYTTDLDFSNGTDKFNKNLPHIEKFKKFKINRTHAWFSFKLFFVNTSMYNEIKRDKPEIIHTIGLRSFQSIIAWRISKKLGIPLILSDQGGLTTHPFLSESGILLKMLYKVQEFFIKHIINQSSAISVGNEYEKEIFENLNNKSNVKIIRNGVNLKNLISTQNFKKKYGIDSKFVLFVGRFSKVKGIRNLILAWNNIKNEERFFDVNLVIMGVNFGYEKEMEELIQNLELSKRVFVIKNPPREDVISAYGESEFLVFPSQWELSPLTPLESFAFKKPVISTNAHGIPYTVKNNENGILVEPENIEELSNALIKLLSDKSLREKLGVAGYNFVHQECNCTSMAKNSLKLYEQVLRNNHNNREISE